MNAYSYSRLSSFEQCPQKLKLQIDRAPSEPSVPMIVGSLAHEAIEQYIRRCLASGVPSDAGVIDDVVARVKKMPAAHAREVTGLLERFCETFEVRLTNPDLETRRAFTRNWKDSNWFGKQVRFRGVMDLVELDGSICQITDWKTGWYIPPRSDLEDSLQLRIYAFLASVLHPQVDDFKLRIWYVRPAFAYEFELHREDLAGVRQELESRMAAIDAETAWKATPGAHCEGCQYRRSCGWYQDAGLGVIPEDTGDLADEYFGLKARLKDFETALKDRVKAEGPLERSGGKVLGFVATESVKIVDMAGAMQALAGAGVTKPELLSELTLSKTAVGKLLRKADAKDRIDSVLAEFGQVSIRNVFKEHKGGGA